jgi:hypothetical protein
MSRIYLILGIIGWTATAIVVPLYVWIGRRTGRPELKD